MQYGVHLEEQETTINIYPKAYSEWCSYYSSNPRDILKYKKLMEKYPEYVKIDREDSIGIFGVIHRSFIPGLRPPRKLTMSAEQRQAMSLRMKALQAKKETND